MKLSRRGFLRGAGAVYAVSHLPFGLQAIAEPVLLHPPTNPAAFAPSLRHGGAEIRVGYAAIAWNGNDLEAIEDIAALGYAGIQLRANALKEYPDPHALRDLLAEHKLQLAALSSGNVALEPAQEASMLAMHAEHARYLQAAGGSVLQVIGTFRAGSQYSAEDYQREGKLLTEIAKRAADYGVQTGFHNHMGSIGQSPEQVEKILAASDPKYVKLLLDTGHYRQGGGDPAAAIDRYADRLLMLHLKDVKPADTKNGYEFTPLGEGEVDFPAVMAALRAISFRGWAVVELDGPEVGPQPSPRESAAISKTYLEQRLKLQV
jgi:inosose dehydratase